MSAEANAFVHVQQRRLPEHRLRATPTPPLRARHSAASRVALVPMSCVRAGRWRRAPQKRASSPPEGPCSRGASSCSHRAVSRQLWLARGAAIGHGFRQVGARTGMPRIPPMAWSTVTEPSALAPCSFLSVLSRSCGAGGRARTAQIGAQIATRRPPPQRRRTPRACCSGMREVSASLRLVVVRGGCAAVDSRRSCARCAESAVAPAPYQLCAGWWPSVAKAARAKSEAAAGSTIPSLRSVSRCVEVDLAHGTVSGTGNLTRRGGN